MKDMIGVLGVLQEHQAFKKDGVCHALTSAMGMGGGMTPIVFQKGSEEMGVIAHMDANSNQRYCLYDTNEESPTLQSTMGTGGGQCPYVAVDEQNMSVRNETVGTLSWRIRKITPKEAFRLMDFSDEDFEKAAAVNSSSQLYKQAGNSIVQNILVAVMGQLLEGKEDVYKTAHKVKKADPIEREVDITEVMPEPICLNSKGGRGGVEGLQPSVQDRVYSTDGISTAMTTAFHPSILVAGQMDNTIDHTFESANRVYNPAGISPTINTCQGGGLQTKIIEGSK